MKRKKKKRKVEVELEQNNSQVIEKEETYTINRLKILEGESKIIPPLMWFYFLSDDKKKIYNIILTNRDFTNESDGIKNYIDTDTRFSVLMDDKDNIIGIRIDTSKEVAAGETLIMNQSGKVYYHPFAVDSLNEYTYCDNDFKEIYKLVLDEFYNNTFLCGDEEFTIDQINEKICEIHQEYMNNKECTPEDVSIKFKSFKTLQYLKNNTFTIDNSKILDGNLKILPYMKWIFIQSNDHPHLFQIDLAIAYKKNYGDVSSNFSNDYVSLTYPYLYEFSGRDNLYSYIYADFIVANNEPFLLDFCENVIASDEYTLEDLKNIIKSVSDEMNTVIYDNEDCINKVSKNLEEVEMFSDDTIKQLIKKGHRNYIDKKEEI